MVLGPRQIQMPDGIVAVGTGNPLARVLHFIGSRVDSFDPANGAYDPSSPGSDGNIAGKGSLQMTLLHGPRGCAGHGILARGRLLAGHRGY